MGNGVDTKLTVIVALFFTVCITPLMTLPLNNGNHKTLSQVNPRTSGVNISKTFEHGAGLPLPGNISSASFPDAVQGNRSSAPSSPSSSFDNPAFISEETDNFNDDYTYEEVHCLPNQFWDDVREVCTNCTVCYPGTQHMHHHHVCGNDECVPCADGQFQEKTGYSSLKCKPCRTCTLAEVLTECGPTHNRVCGKCLDGTFSPLGLANICAPCESEDDSPSCKGFAGGTTERDDNLKTDVIVTQESDVMTHDIDLVDQTDDRVTPSGDPLTHNNDLLTDKVIDVFKSTTQPVKHVQQPALSIGDTIIIALLVPSVFFSFAILIWRHFHKQGINRTGNSTKQPLSSDTIAVNSPTGESQDSSPSSNTAMKFSNITGKEQVALRKQCNTGFCRAGFCPTFDIGSSEDINASSTSLSMPKDLRSWNEGDELHHSAESVNEASPFLSPNYGKNDRRPLAQEPGSPDSAKTNLSFENDDSIQRHGDMKVMPELLENTATPTEDQVPGSPDSAKSKLSFEIDALSLPGILMSSENEKF